MVQVHTVCVCYLLALWVVLANEVCHVDGEPSTPIHNNNYPVQPADANQQDQTELKLLHVVSSMFTIMSILHSLVCLHMLNVIFITFSCLYYILVIEIN